MGYGCALGLRISDVPIFSPSTIAAAISNGIQPMFSIMRVRATVALEDWRTRVRRVPKARNMSTDPNPKPVHLEMNESTSGCVSRSGTDSFMNESPRNSRANPMMNSPMFLVGSSWTWNR